MSRQSGPQQISHDIAMRTDVGPIQLYARSKSLLRLLSIELSVEIAVLSAGHNIR